MRTLALTLSLVVGLSLLGASSSAQVDDSIPKKPLFDLKGYNQCPSNFQPPDQPQELRCASGKAILESVRVKKYDRDRKSVV